MSNSKGKLLAVLSGIVKLSAFGRNFTQFPSVQRVATATQGPQTFVAQSTMILCRQSMPRQSEQVSNFAEDRQEPLRVRRRLEFGRMAAHSWL